VERGRRSYEREMEEMPENFADGGMVQMAAMEAAMRAAPAGPSSQAVQAAPGSMPTGAVFDPSLQAQTNPNAALEAALRAGTAQPRPTPPAPAPAFDSQAFGTFYQGLDQSQQGLIQSLLSHLGNQYNQRQQQMMGGIMGMAPPQMRGYMPMMQAPMQYGGYMPQQMYGGYPTQQMYGGYMPQQMYGGYMPQQMYSSPYMGGMMPQQMQQTSYAPPQQAYQPPQAPYAPPQQASPFGGSLRGYYA
jgi:hypothetical protein